MHSGNGELSHVRLSSLSSLAEPIWSSQGYPKISRWFARKLRVALRLARETASAKLSLSEKAVKIAL